MSMKKLAFTAAISILPSCCIAGLAPLPGTLLVTCSTLGNGVIRQYDALTGQQVGSLQVLIDGQPASLLGEIAWANGHIYVGAYRLQQPFGGIGIVDAVAGTFNSIVSMSVGSNMDAFQGGFIAGQEGTGRGVYDANFNPIGGGFALDDPSIFVDDFRGTATTPDGFVTTCAGLYGELIFWSSTGQHQGNSFFNNSNPVGELLGLEYDESNGAFWIGEAAGTSMLRYYVPSSPNQVWSTSVPGVISDLAYIPIPAPAGLCAVGAASTLLLRRRR